MTIQKAPTFFLTAIGAARVIGGPPGRMAPLLLIFHKGAGVETAIQINAATRATYPRIEQLQIASVVSLKHVPTYMRSAQEFNLSIIYQNVAKEIPPFCSPSDYVVILPDWEDKVTNAFGMDKHSYLVGLAVITQPWQLFGTYIGPEPQSAVVEMLAAATQSLAKPTIDGNLAQPI